MSNENPEHVWLAKYALSGGIECCRVNQISDGYAYVQGHMQAYKLGRDCALTRDEAVKIAEEMRVAKIASHRKSIAKLEKMTFGVAQ